MIIYKLGLYNARVHFKNSIDAIEDLINQNIIPIVLEQTIHSVSIYDLKFEFPVCIILGNEVNGISEKLVKKVKLHAEIPMKGIKQSLNVSVAAGIAGFEIARQYLVK